MFARNSLVMLVLTVALTTSCQQTTAPEETPSREDLASANGPGDNPTGKGQCKKGGWRAFGFKNQGQCIRFVNTGKDSRNGAPALVFASVDAGDSHTCAVTTAGKAYCWGRNDFGGLGNGTNTDSNVPVPVSGGHTFASVTAGLFHSCGVTTSGKAYCWGWNADGGLGNGTNTDSNVPVAVAGGHTFASVSAGGFHSIGFFDLRSTTCGVTPAGAAYCWGPPGYGDLGIGTFAGTNVPMPVLGGHIFRSVSKGTRHTCGVDTAGTAYCWGFNLYGQLGNGSQSSVDVPTAVSDDHTFASVSAADRHTCGVTTALAAYCWGSNSWGQLGYTLTNTTVTYSKRPVAVKGGHTFASVTTGGYHSCGVSTGGTAYCWGRNDFGELGNGANFDETDVPVVVSGGRTFASVTAGDLHSCGVTTTGAVYCWGSNAYGQLGNGTNIDSNVPVEVSLP